MQDNEKFQVVSTKVSNEAYILLQLLCRKVGITMYDFLQMTVDTLIRYMDGNHNLSPEMEQAMAIFDHLQGWRDAVNLADPSGNMEVHEATYYFSESGKKGCRAVHTEIPFMGEKIATCNIQEILEKTLCLLCPERYRRLRLLAVDMGTPSLLSCLDKMITEHEKEEDARAIRQGFEDNSRHEFGRDYNSPHYKQHKKRGPDNAADRKRIEGELTIFEYDNDNDNDNNDNDNDNNDNDNDALEEVPTVDELATMEEAETGEADE